MYCLNKLPPQNVASVVFPCLYLSKTTSGCDFVWANSKILQLTSAHFKQRLLNGGWDGNANLAWFDPWCTWGVLVTSTWVLGIVQPWGKYWTWKSHIFREYAFALQNSVHWLEKQCSLEQQSLQGVNGQVHGGMKEKESGIRSELKKCSWPQTCQSSKSVWAVLSGTGWIVGVSVQGQKLKLIFLVGPSNLRIFHDSMINLGFPYLHGIAKLFPKFVFFFWH